MKIENNSSVSIAIIGAGLSGLLMGIELKKAGITNFTIYEKDDDVGGTWKINNYPGLHCDIPSHLYAYSFEPNPNWQMPYAAQADIHAYFQHCAKKYGLLPHIRFNTDIRKAEYESDSGSWCLETDSGESFQHRLLIGASGGLTAPNLPRIEGLDIFQGKSWHSAEWQHDFDLTDKRIAVIGSAASAIQIVPQVAQSAKELYVFQRTPNWVLPRNNVPYKQTTKEAFADPATGALKHHQRTLYRNSFLSQRVFKREEKAVSTMRRIADKHMKRAISDPALIAQLTPEYEPGCKRLLVSDDFYPTLGKDHVHLINSAVEGLSETAVLSADGKETEVDVVIFCTGYKLGGRADGSPAMEIVGPDKTLRQTLRARPEAYRGIAIPGIPNYFTICGLNGLVGYTAVIASAEIHTDYLCRLIQMFEQQNIRGIDAKVDSTILYNQSLQEQLKDMVWSSGCSNYYLDRNGFNRSLYPGTLSQLRREYKEIILSDFNIEPF